MIRWRIILGTLLIATLGVLCWFDAHAGRPGIYLMPLVVLLAPLAANEMLGFFRRLGHQPLAWTIHVGTLLPVLASCVPIIWQPYPENCPIGTLGWLACGLAGSMLVALVGEMRRFDAPGTTVQNLAMSTLTILYVGGLIGFIVQLRIIDIDSGMRGDSQLIDDGSWGMVAWLSLVFAVKLSDIGQYMAGHLWGRRKLAPILSPGKTWEGALGGIVLAITGSLIALGPLAEALDCASNRSPLLWFGSCLVYGVIIGIAGIVGDLGESLLKRDAGVKDSSNWLPGFGGVLDMLDSLLVAAPIAYFCWVVRLVGP